jgi:hypothetical protein
VTGVVAVVLVVLALLLIWRFFGLLRRLVTRVGGRGSGPTPVGAKLL